MSLKGKKDLKEKGEHVNKVNVAFVAILLSAVLGVAVAAANASGNSVILTTDKSAYAQGEGVAISATNNGNTLIGYSVCKPDVSISMNGRELLLFQPDSASCMAFASIRPGETTKILTWNQQYFIGGQEVQADAGTYVISFQGVHATIVISGQANPPQPPTNPKTTFTLNLNQGWNLVSEPVYNNMKYFPMMGKTYPVAVSAAVGDDAKAYQGGGRYMMPYPYGKPSIVSNTCGEITLWNYNGNDYSQTPLANWNVRQAYWIHADSACQITFGGDSEVNSTNYMQSVGAGWHLITAPADSTSFQQIEGTCGAHLLSGPWQYINGAYAKADSLTAGSGYWIKTDGACILRNIANQPPLPPQ